MLTPRLMHRLAVRVSHVLAGLLLPRPPPDDLVLARNIRQR